jgi:GT2 family glycosyltransferase
MRKNALNNDGSHVIDIIVPVYNAPECVAPCLDSVLRNSDHEYRVIVIDDGSDQYTKDLIRQLAQHNDQIHVITNESNLGFIKSCNKAIQYGDSEYLVLLNSDTVVPPGWLSRLKNCMDSDDRIGIANPLSNEAANLSIPIAPGCNFLGQDHGLRDLNPDYPDIVTAVGFCLVMRRQMLDEIGLFDEIYELGYCEETDLCICAMQANWRVVACDNLYIYHKGNASFADRDARFGKNLKIFMHRHGRYYRKEYAAFIKRAALDHIRNLVSESAIGMSEKMYRVARTIASDLAGLHILRARRHLRERNIIPRVHKSPERYRLFWRNNRPTITFIFESLEHFGGVVSVMRIINGLILQGYEVRVAALHGGEGQIKGLYFQPFYFGSIDDLVKNIPYSDVFISTFWITAYWLSDVKNKYPDSTYVSYLQDDETLFYPGNADQQGKVINSYNIPDQIISTSKWLEGRLKRHNKSSTVIPKGVDLDIFRVLETEERTSMSVLAMARPDAHHRGYKRIIEIFSRINKSAPGTVFGIFGSDRNLAGDFDVPVVEYGHVENGTQLARLYNKYSIYIDPSDFQGFGMMGLEAMSCGCPCVLTNNGGITEYAIDGYNCILSNPHDVEYIAGKTIRILEDENLRRSIINNGLKTVQEFSLKTEIERMGTCLGQLTQHHGHLAVDTLNKAI